MFGIKKPSVPRRVRTVGFVLLYAFYFVAFEASCADVIVGDFSVFYIRYFLHVRLKGSSRLTVRVADVVARRLSLSADAAYSRHIITLRSGSFRSVTVPRQQTSYHYFRKKAIKNVVFSEIFLKFRKKMQNMLAKIAIIR